MKRHIPNSITLLNLVSGVLAICAVFLGQLHLLPWLVGFALFCDLIDGMIARATNTGSELGVQLDSLADMVTFGVLPGILLFYMGTNDLQNTTTVVDPGFAYLAFLYPVCAALRLGKFNIDTRQTETFLGMPTPAGAMLVLGLFQWYSGDSMISQLLYNPLVIAAISVLLSILMVTEIPMLSLKFKKFAWQGNELKWILVIGMIACGVIFGADFFAPAILWYLVLSIIAAMVTSGQKKESKF